MVPGKKTCLYLRVRAFLRCAPALPAGNGLLALSGLPPLAHAQAGQAGVMVPYFPFPWPDWILACGPPGRIMP